MRESFPRTDAITRITRFLFSYGVPLFSDSDSESFERYKFGERMMYGELLGVPSSVPPEVLIPDRYRIGLFATATKRAEKLTVTSEVSMLGEMANLMPADPQLGSKIGFAALFCYHHRTGDDIRTENEIGGIRLALYESGIYRTEASGIICRSTDPEYSQLYSLYERFGLTDALSQISAQWPYGGVVPRNLTVAESRNATDLILDQLRPE